MQSWRGQPSTIHDCISSVECLGDTLEVGHYITKDPRHNSSDWISHDNIKVTEATINGIGVPHYQIPERITWVELLESVDRGE